MTAMFLQIWIQLLPPKANFYEPRFIMTPSLKADPKNTRAQIVDVLIAIQRGQSLSSLLDGLLSRVDSSNKSFAHALLLTTLRHWHAQSRLIDSLADNPIDEVEVRTVLQLGLTQLLYLQVPDYAAIHETVEAAKGIGFGRAAALINAILRKVAKNPAKFRKKADKNHSLPNWLAYQLKQDWPEVYDDLTQNLRQPAPMFLRVNNVVESLDNYKKALADSDIDVDTVDQTISLKLPQTSKTVSQALRLTSSLPVSALPRFDEGTVSVQDLHAQLAAPIIHQALLAKVKNDDNNNNNNNNNADAKPIQILDACAAPGGKLAHWLDLLNQDSAQFHVKQIDITALDNEALRIARIEDNLQRLQLTTLPKLAVTNVCDDATTWQAVGQSSIEVGFDAILLDAPCTATGVIRRHPDIGLLRVEEDVAQTAALQASILDNLWPQLKVGGYLLYVTCSLLKAENVQQMTAFIQRHSDAKAVDFDDDSSFGIAQAVGRQCLVLDPNGGDGFYFALLQKQAAT